MRVKFAAAIFILLAAPCFCLAQSQQQAQTAQQKPTVTSLQESPAPAALLFAAVAPGVFAVSAETTGPLHFAGATLRAGAPKREVSAFGMDARPRQGEPRPYDGIAASAFPQQERPGVPQGAPPATFNITRHGKIIFVADVREPGSARIVLTETIEVSSVKSKQEWTDFISAFVNATSRAWLSMIPSSAAAKKGKIVIAFALRHDGSLEGALSIPQSSGDSAIDDATRLTIAKSVPFSELPSNFRSAAAQFRVTFAYNHPHSLTSGSAKDNGPAQ